MARSRTKKGSKQEVESNKSNPPDKIVESDSMMKPLDQRSAVDTSAACISKLNGFAKVWNEHIAVFEKERNTKYDRNSFNNNLLFDWYGLFERFLFVDGSKASILESKGYYKVGDIALSKLPPVSYETTQNTSVFIAKNFVPDALARECRKFLSSAWVKHTENTVMLATIRDEWDINQQYMLRDTYDLSILRLGTQKHSEITTDSYNYGMWKWEKYNPEFYRVTPSNLLSFVLSPIYKLIQCIVARWCNTTQFLDYNLSGLKLDTFVIQKIPKGSGIAPHNDEWKGRRIAFIYYLTDDGWTSEDGGNFCVVADDSENHSWDLFIPEFNSMIMMTMNENKSPLHKVDTVMTDKNRYALVGFLSDR